MGDSLSKHHSGKQGHSEVSASRAQGRKTRLSFDARGPGRYSASKQSLEGLSSRRGGLLTLRRLWQASGGLRRDRQANGGLRESIAVGRASSGTQQQKPAFTHEVSSGDFDSLASSLQRKVAATSGGGLSEDDFQRDSEEFTARAVKLPGNLNADSPLFKAYADFLEFMEDDVLAALARHPCPDEALGLIYVCCSSEPLPVEHSVEPNSDVLAYVMPGTYMKVLEFTAYRTQMEYMLRLKTAEGWVTGASIRIMRLPHSPRLTIAKGATAGPFNSKRGMSQRLPPAACLMSSLVGTQDSGGAANPVRSFPSAPCGTTSTGPLSAAAGHRPLEDSHPSTCWGIVNACRVTRFCSFQTCLKQTRHQACYTSLSKFVPASAMQSFGTTLLDNLPGLATKAGTAQARDMPCSKTEEVMREDEALSPRSSLDGEMSLMEHPFMLFRVVASRAIPVSASPHLASPVVGRLLHRQVFPVIDACLACCSWSCSLFEGEGDCLISGMGCLGQGSTDVLHAVARSHLCSRKSRKRLGCLSRTRSMQLRVCTPQGWVTFDKSIEKVDECGTIYEHPVPYEIVADGYLVNVRASLEVEGPVRRTLPPASIVEVYERKVNAEGLMRLRVADGWINERRKGVNDAGLLFAVRGGDYRASTFVRQVTAAIILLPALCSTDSSVRTAAATWLAANVARSAVASTALMDEVDETMVEEELNRCPCCYCRGEKSLSDTEAFKATGASMRRENAGHRLPGGCLLRDALPVAEVPFVALPGSGSLAGEPASEKSSQVPESVPAADGSSAVNPLSANDLLLMREVSASQASALTAAELQRKARLPSVTAEQPPHAGGAARPHSAGSNADFYEGYCHRGSCSSENILNNLPECTGGVLRSVRAEDSQEADRLWNTLNFLVKVLCPANYLFLLVSCARKAFCVGSQLSPDVQVYSSLGEQREAVGSQAIYRPPVGAYVPSSNQQNPLLLNGAPQQSLLAAYVPKQPTAKGNLPAVNLNRWTSFTFHQPLIIVIHKVERICNEFLTRRYLHERSMLMLLNRGGGRGLEEDIPNPLLKVYEALNEYFLFHGCTEERAGLVALSGFDFRRGGENGGKLFGVGTYFSPNASKADLYARPAEPSNKLAAQAPVKTAPPQKPAVPLKGCGGQQPSATALPAGLSNYRGIPSQRVSYINQALATDSSASRAGSAAHQATGNYTWMGYASTMPVTSMYPCPQSLRPARLPNPAKERGGLLAVYAKLRHGGSRSKDSVEQKPPQVAQKPPTPQPPNPAKQYPTTQDGGVPKPKQSGATVASTTGHAVPSAASTMRCLLLARVCLGDVYKTLSTMPDARMPPNKPDPIAPKLAYDSVSFFVFFVDAVASHMLPTHPQQQRATFPLGICRCSLQWEAR
ncbi:hypothetical protein Efla_002017 [Eimeria flavescens]